MIFCATPSGGRIFARAQLAIAESQHLRHQSQILRARQELERGRLRVVILESAMCRSEIIAFREDKMGACGPAARTMDRLF